MPRIKVDKIVGEALEVIERYNSLNKRTKEVRVERTEEDKAMGLWRFKKVKLDPKAKNFELKKRGRKD